MLSVRESMGTLSDRGAGADADLEPAPLGKREHKAVLWVKSLRV